MRRTLYRIRIRRGHFVEEAFRFRAARIRRYIELRFELDAERFLSAATFLHAEIRRIATAYAENVGSQFLSLRQIVSSFSDLEISLGAEPGQSFARGTAWPAPND
jgi:hypothetical protein